MSIHLFSEPVFSVFFSFLTPFIVRIRELFLRLIAFLYLCAGFYSTSKTSQWSSSDASA
ncbi:hypothetical protein C8J56DRAFT_478984 [Mycena floridula]|nr:hypothetical protein C8J56DRAFT_478984 [Mycena floridula]